MPVLMLMLIREFGSTVLEIVQALRAVVYRVETRGSRNF